MQLVNEKVEKPKAKIKKITKISYLFTAISLMGAGVNLYTQNTYEQEEYKESLVFEKIADNFAKKTNDSILTHETHEINFHNIKSSEFLNYLSQESGVKITFKAKHDSLITMVAPHMTYEDALNRFVEVTYFKKTVAENGDIEISD